VAYRVFETKEFTASLQGLGKAVVERVSQKLKAFVYPALARNPRFGPNIKRLRNVQLATWRYRVGDYRFLYTDEDQEVAAMLLAVRRRDAYG